MLRNVVEELYHKHGIIFLEECYMMIDTHCHLLKEDYPDLEKIINHMGNNIMIVSGADIAANREVMELIDHYPNIFGCVGFHPDEASTITKNDLKELAEMLKHPKIVALGEIGLDYRFGKDNAEKQRLLFLNQIALARNNQKAIVIHSRDAIEETYEIIKGYATDMKMVMHCFGSSLEMAQKFTKLGVMLGIGGVVTFKNGNRLQEVVKGIDLKYLLLETDSPYLTPVPHRGEQNEPVNITYIATKISELKMIPLETVYKITTSNAIRQFDLNHFL